LLTIFMDVCRWLRRNVERFGREALQYSSQRNSCTRLYKLLFRLIRFKNARG